MQLFPVPLPLDRAAGPPLADGAGPAAPDVDFTIIERKSFRYGARVGLSLLSTAHSRLNVTYGFTKTMTPSGDRTADFEVQNAGIGFTRRLTQYTSLRTGYAFREGTYDRPGQPLTRMHSVDVGIDYTKPLSRRRRTFVHFSTGSGIAEQESVLPDDKQAELRRLHVLGSASLVHQMGRTWTAQTQYRREIRYIQGFVSPVFSDSATAGVSGLLTRRTDVAVNASYFTGTVGLARGLPRFSSYSASARLRRALTRTLAAYVEYLFYHYDFDELSFHPAGVPPQFNRNGVRVGLSLWIPLTD